MIDFCVGEHEGRGVILVDGEVFDWGLDDESLEEANLQEDMRSVHMDIMNHLLDSLSELIGFRPTIKQVNEALKKGSMG